MHSKKNEKSNLPFKPSGKVNLIVGRLGNMVNTRNQQQRTPPQTSSPPISNASRSLPPHLAAKAALFANGNRRNSAPTAMRGAHKTHTSSHSTLTTLGSRVSNSRAPSAMHSSQHNHHSSGHGRKSAPGGMSLYGGVSRLGALSANNSPHNSVSLPPHQQAMKTRNIAKKTPGVGPVSHLARLGGSNATTLNRLGNNGRDMKNPRKVSTAPNGLTALGKGSKQQKRNNLPPHLRALGQNAASSQRNSMLQQSNPMKRRLPVHDQPRKKRRTGSMHNSSAANGFGGLDSSPSSAMTSNVAQPDCCIRDCKNQVEDKVRFALNLYTDDSFKGSYVACGWNKVCNYHFFSDKLKFKKLNDDEENKLSVDNYDESDFFDTRRKTKRKRNSHEDDEFYNDSQYNSTASHSQQCSTAGGQRSTQKLPSISTSRSHLHRMQRASLGRINTNFTRKKRSARFETVAISPEQDASTQQRIRAKDEEEDEMSEINLSSSSASSSNTSRNADVNTSTASGPTAIEGAKNEDDESFEMPPATMLSLYQLNTPATPAYEDLNLMHESAAGTGVKEGGAPSTIQKLLQSNRTGLTPRSPGDLPFELISSASVNTSALPHFANHDPAFHGTEEVSNKLPQRHSRSSLLQEHEDDDHPETGGDDDSDYDMSVVEDGETTHWRRLDAYSSDEEDDVLSTSDQSSGGALDEEESNEIYILSSALNADEDKTNARNKRKKNSKSKKQSNATRLKTLEKKKKKSDSVREVNVPRRVDRGRSKRNASSSGSVLNSAAESTAAGEFTNDNTEDIETHHAEARSNRRRAAESQFFSHYIELGSDDEGSHFSSEHDASTEFQFQETEEANGEDVTGLSDDAMEFFAHEQRVVDLGMIMG